jgi:putative flippase GtrA
MLTNTAPELLEGTVEADETFVGGKNKNREDFKKQAKRYFIMCGFFYFANIGILYIGIEQLHLAKIIAQIISTAMLTTISYTLSKLIFKNPEQ